MLKFKFLVITTCLLSLVACVQQPRSIPTLPLAAREQILADMQSWKINGKLGLRFQHTGHNISFEWRQSKDKYYLYLYSPLASESAKINGSQAGATLVTVDRQEYSAPSAERLIFEHLGYDFPVTKLVYWIKGTAAPTSGSKYANYDQFNQLQSLQQDGWLIEYQSYHAISPVTLPEKMVISNGKITVKIIIRDWKK